MSQSESAQDTFKRLFRDEVAPAIRAMGLRGSGQTFQLPSDTHWAMVGIQKSVSSDQRDVKFTVNLKAVSKTTWDVMRRDHSYLPVKPSANTQYGTFEWNERIGLLMPERRDKWWHLRPGEDPAPVIAELIEAVRRYGIPALRKSVSGDR